MMVILNPIKERTENDTARQTDIFVHRPTASALLQTFLLGACFVVQIGAPEMSRMPGVRRAIQMMDDHSAASAMPVTTNSILPAANRRPSVDAAA
ncbi:hypothetical protein CU102_24240 [Phyllobacterium brassicacearum]|uniref:Uncharacterized protein n=1 Tax=Phyllobacterium brassicacearum TaxID=314235 RepID=A0A2P7B988_9HYPH|nr:hypothetical protein CU102_24240 [Phyllobacterium brassicacearum]